MSVSPDPVPAVQAGKGFLSDLLATAAHQAAGAGETGARLAQQFASWQQTADTTAFAAFLPLAFTLLVLHEMSEAALGDGPFRVRYVLVRTGVIVGLLLSYDLVVGLITEVASSQGDFGTWDQIMGPVEQGWKRQWDAYPDGIGLGDIADVLVWLIFFAILALCAVLAYACSLLLSIAQGTLLAILLTLGKTCIVVSLVPGITVGKAWAKYLAMLCGWSSLAGAVNTVILGAMAAQIAGKGSVGGFSLAGFKYFFGLAALYIVYAVFTVSIPKLTSAIFSGAASHAPGVGAAVAMGLGALGVHRVANAVPAAGAGLVKGGAGLVKGAARAVGIGGNNSGNGDDRPDGSGRGGASRRADGRPHKTQHAGRQGPAPGIAAAALASRPSKGASQEPAGAPARSSSFGQKRSPDRSASPAAATVDAASPDSQRDRVGSVGSAASAPAPEKPHARRRQAPPQDPGSAAGRGGEPVTRNLLAGGGASGRPDQDVSRQAHRHEQQRAGENSSMRSARAGDGAEPAAPPAVSAATAESARPHSTGAAATSGREPMPAAAGTTTRPSLRPDAPTPYDPDAPKRAAELRRELDEGPTQVVPTRRVHKLPGKPT